MHIFKEYVWGYIAPPPPFYPLLNTLKKWRSLLLQCVGKGMFWSHFRVL